MKRVKQAVHLVLLAALFCVMLTAPAFAAGDDGSVWATPSETSEGTTAPIVTDTTVTDGVVTLTYDSSELTYVGVTVDEAYVAMYAVNAEEAGVVRISWVAPGEYEADASGTTLIQVNFTGKGTVSLSGEANNVAGEPVPVKNADDSSNPTDPSNPADSSDSVTPENPGSSSSSPTTGDNANIILPVAVMVCAAGAIVVLIVMKRRAGK